MVALIALSTCCCLESAAACADEKLPPPRLFEDDDAPGFSASDFARLLQQIRSERDALRADWQSLIKKEGRSQRDIDEELHVHLKQILHHLQQRTQAAPAPPTPMPPRAGGSETNKNDPPAGVAKLPSVAADKNPEHSPTGADVMAQAHLFYRSGQFEEALASFRLIDLKGQKAAVRAPMEYLMAMCLLHLGKTEEALPLLREVANSRGDDKLASYAQWHLEMLRWQRDVQQRLQDFRQRRESLEKR